MEQTRESRFFWAPVPPFAFFIIVLLKNFLVAYGNPEKDPVCFKTLLHGKYHPRCQREWNITRTPCLRPVLITGTAGVGDARTARIFRSAGFQTLWQNHQVMDQSPDAEVLVSWFSRTDVEGLQRASSYHWPWKARFWENHAMDEANIPLKPEMRYSGDQEYANRMSRCLFKTVLLQVRDPTLVIGSLLGYVTEAPGPWLHQADALLRFQRPGGSRKPLPGSVPLAEEILRSPEHAGAMAMVHAVAHTDGTTTTTPPSSTTSGSASESPRRFALLAAATPLPKPPDLSAAPADSVDRAADWWKKSKDEAVRFLLHYWVQWNAAALEVVDAAFRVEDADFSAICERAFEVESEDTKEREEEPAEKEDNNSTGPRKLTRARRCLLMQKAMEDDDALGDDHDDLTWQQQQQQQQQQHHHHHHLDRGIGRIAPIPWSELYSVDTAMASQAFHLAWGLGYKYAAVEVVVLQSPSPSIPTSPPLVSSPLLPDAEARAPTMSGAPPPPPQRHVVDLNHELAQEAALQAQPSSPSSASPTAHVAPTETIPGAMLDITKIAKREASILGLDCARTTKLEAALRLIASRWLEDHLVQPPPNEPPPCTDTFETGHGDNEYDGNSSTERRGANSTERTGEYGLSDDIGVPVFLPEAPIPPVLVL